MSKVFSKLPSRKIPKWHVIKYYKISDDHYECDKLPLVLNKFQVCLMILQDSVNYDH